MPVDDSIIKHINDRRGERWVADVYGIVSLHGRSTTRLYSTFVISKTSSDPHKEPTMIRFRRLGISFAVPLPPNKWKISFRGQYFYFSDSLENCKEQVMGLVRQLKMEPVRRSLK